MSSRIRRAAGRLRGLGPRSLLRSLRLELDDRLIDFARIVLPENRTGDRLFALLRFVQCHGRMPDDSQSFNDCLFRIKTSDEILDPLRVFVTDKEFVKLYVRATVGEHFNVPTIDVIRAETLLDSYEFPRTCCIKPTHASGQVILRRAGEPVDVPRLRQWFAVNYYLAGREANYRFLRPKIIVEPLIFGGVGVDDYKFFCCDGQVRMIQVDVDRHTDHRRVMFDANWVPQDFTIAYPRASTSPRRPQNLEQMLEVARALCRPFGFVRVDLYSNGHSCLVGEITNCHGNAGESFIPKEAEQLASRMLFGRQGRRVQAAIDSPAQ